MRLIFSICFFLIGFILQAQTDTLQYQKFYHGDSLISSEGYFYLGKPHGLWKNYYPNQNLKSVGFWKKGVLTGKWIFFNEQADTTEIIHYRNGQKSGWNFKYENNKIYLKQLFLDSKIIGVSYLYKNGLVTEIPYKNGLKHGLALVYQDEKIIELIDYKNGYPFSTRKVNRYNKLHLKKGAWIDLFSNKLIHVERNFKNDTLNGYYREYSQSGVLLKNWYYKMGVLDSTALRETASKLKQDFYPNGNLKSTGFYRNNKKVGLHQAYSQDSKIITAKLYSEEGVFLGEGMLDRNEKRKGLWKFYYEDETIKSTGYYKKGRRTKQWIFYYHDGEIEQKGKYKNGKYHNTWLFFDEKGNRLKLETYRKGKLNGVYKQFNLKGEVLLSGEYKDGLKDGHWQYTYSNITINEYYDLGQKHGKFESTYANGKTAYQGKFVQGFPNGKHLTYFMNGRIKSYQYYVHGSKERIWTWYDEDGFELYNYTYKNDKIFKINGKKYKFIDDED